MRVQLLPSRGQRLLLAAVLLLLAGSAAHAQRAGDTTSVACGPPQPMMLCVDLDARASIDSLAGPFTYRWLMGDGTTLTGPAVSHCYKERKKYTVQLDVVVQKTGEVRRAQKLIPINLVQDIVDFAAQPTRVRVGESVAFTAAPDAQLPDCINVRLIWDFRDGFTAQGRAVQHAFRRPGTFLVRFSMRGNGSDACVSSHCVSREIVVEP